MPVASYTHRRALGTRFIIWGASVAVGSALIGTVTTLASANLFLVYAPTLAVCVDLGYAAAMCFGMPFAAGLLCVGIALRRLYRAEESSSNALAEPTQTAPAVLEG